MIKKTNIKFLWASKAITAENIHWGQHATHFGDIIVAATDHGVCAVEFCDKNKRENTLKKLAKMWPKARLVESPKVTGQYAERILTPPKKAIKDSMITVHIFGTPFQRIVWQALLEIPFASQRSYREIAENIGNPNASRAVGSAVGANSVAILIPCHRVVHSDGKLGNYRWGKQLKRDLLEWEVRISCR